MALLGENEYQNGDERSCQRGYEAESEKFLHGYSGQVRGFLNSPACNHAKTVDRPTSAAVKNRTAPAVCRPDAGAERRIDDPFVLPFGVPR